MQKQPSRKKVNGNHLDAEFFAFFGSSGSGKTHALRETFKELDRRQTLVWSPKEHQDDYAGWLKAKRFSVYEILPAVKHARTGKDIVIVSSLNRSVDEPAFNIFCKLSHEIAKLHTCTMISEELHTVTRPNGGQQGWANANLMGRADGLRIMAGSQRPAKVDKEFFGQISHAWCGRQNFEEDAKTTARLVLTDMQTILELPRHKGITRIMG